MITKMTMMKLVRIMELIRMIQLVRMMKLVGMMKLVIMLFLHFQDSVPKEKVSYRSLKPFAGPNEIHRS